MCSRARFFLRRAPGRLRENLADRIWTEDGSLDSKLADGKVLIHRVAHTMHAVGKKMAFLVIRQFTSTVQCILTVTEELVSMQMAIGEVRYFPK
ncbi:hypothetical protein IEQ34_010498 [Dendrobium chrysotoxum]|uniref:Uncharacterized protein n=1 Tax=Dendrobium chrysotoxum TaxID=161865 RepID=A0AAV7GUS7_DENCH|nr:hypothetical protein IEQ34_010498 [Dendrobium chrysotoxum]